MSKTVLIIDDDPVVAEVATMSLREGGFNTAVAPDGRSGLAAVQAHRPDLIVLDVDMPDLDGFEVNRRLKGNDDLSSIPVVFHSGNGTASDRRKALAAGAVAFVVKPNTVPDLLNAVRVGLGQGRQPEA